MIYELLAGPPSFVNTMVKILPLILVAVLGMILAEATPTSRDISQCNAASLLCCNTVLPASDPAMSVILALLGVVVVPTSIKCGLTCDPVNVIGAGGINW